VDLGTENSSSLGWLTTRGRVTGRERKVELWWSTDGVRVYLISGGGDRSDWVRNLLAEPAASFATRGGSLAVRARLPLVDEAERDLASRLLAQKYGRDAERWRRHAYLVALDPVVT
jgi:deazaflavin-dependent oxidoreductase (nitroreductase family)